LASRNTSRACHALKVISQNVAWIVILALFCQASLRINWQDNNRSELNRKKRLRRAANPAKYQAKDKMYDAVRRGERISKPHRGIGVLQPNLRDDQCRAIIKQPVPPVYGVTQRKREELEAFKKTLPKETVCCGSAVVPGSRWCKYHEAVRCRLEQADTGGRLISAMQW
jgi:hypothetical protein